MNASCRLLLSCTLLLGLLTACSNDTAGGNTGDSDGNSRADTLSQDTDQSDTSFESDTNLLEDAASDSAEPGTEPSDTMETPPDGAEPTPDTMDTVAPTDSNQPSDSSEDDTEAPDADTQAPDTGNTDTGNTDTAEPPPASPLPPMYEMAEGCAEPLDYITNECANVVCPAGHTCMGLGHCVPAEPFFLDSDPTQYQVKVALARAPGGGFAAAWYSVYWPAGQSLQAMDVFARVYQADGTPLTEPVKLDEDIMAWARSPSITPLGGGGWLVAWRGQAGLSGEVRYLARVVDAAGQATGLAFQLNDTVLESETMLGSNVDSPFVTPLRTGQVAVAWMGQPVGTNNSDVFLRVMTPEGTFQTPELDVGAWTPGLEGSPVVTDTLETGLAMFWQYTEPSSTGPKDPNAPPPPATPQAPMVRGRVFDNQVNAITPVLSVSPQLEPFEGMPSATTFDSGQILLTWKTRQTAFATTATDVYGLRLSGEAGDTAGTLHLFGSDSSGTYPFYAPTGASGPDRAAVVWHSLANDQDGVYVRRYYAQEDVLDCEKTPVAGPTVALEQGGRRLPAVLGFPDGRILVGWESNFQHPNGGKSLTRVRLRYLK